MLTYLLRRSAFLVVSLVVAMIALFVLLRLLPGDPANALLSVGATPEQIAAARAPVGSDQPLLAAVRRLVGAARSAVDLGDSFISSLPVGPEIASRLAVTLPLTLLAFVARACCSRSSVGFIAAVRADRWYGIALSGFSQLGHRRARSSGSACCWSGVFALKLGLLPSGGFPRDDWADPADALRSLALPVITIALVMSASLIRYVRSATLDVLGSDYLRTARAAGAGFGRGAVAARAAQRRGARDLDPRHRAGDDASSARSWWRASSRCPASAACC